MGGYILLAGGAEFGGEMAALDRRAMDLAGGPDAPIRIIPTAAAPDDNHERAGANGRHWFESLGATDVCVVPLIDAAAANDATIATELETARFIYLLGGFPGYLGQTLRDSASWAAMQRAHCSGAVIGGSSAGAMVLCEHFYNPSAGEVVAGLGLVPAACILPHFRPGRQAWIGQLRRAVPHATLIGIAERTGLLNDTSAGAWSIHGGGGVAVFRPNNSAAPAMLAAGDTLMF